MTHPHVEEAERFLDEQLAAEDVVAQAEAITSGQSATAEVAHAGEIDYDVARAAFGHIRRLRALGRDEDEAEHHDDARRVLSRFEGYFTEAES